MLLHAEQNDWQRAGEWIQEADGLVICASNGFSMSENFAILRPSRWFDENFADFRRKSGIQTPLQGLNDPYPDPEEFNAFYSRLLKGIHYDKPVSPIMQTLRKITKIRVVYILTTNAEDRFAQAGYPENEVFYLEGRFTHRGDHHYISKEDLSSIRSPMELETASYPGSEEFEKKLKKVNAFLSHHPRFVILVLGVSANSGFLSLSSIRYSQLIRAAVALR